MRCKANINSSCRCGSGGRADWKSLGVWGKGDNFRVWATGVPTASNFRTQMLDLVLPKGTPR
jgi:hypothetical protein